MQFYIRVPIFSLSLLLKNNSGRNHSGKISRYNRGKRYQRKYRIIDFKFLLWNMYVILLRREYDPYRNTLLYLICYQNGILSYILMLFQTEVRLCIHIGLLLNLYHIVGDITNFNILTEGTNVSAVELYPFKGSKVSRSSGTSVLFLKRFQDVSLIQMPSKRNYYMISNNCVNMIGVVRTRVSVLIKEEYYKAGQLKFKGKKSTVRGVAKNPVDHPHGGGEGRTSGGRPNVTPNSLPAKKRKTRKNLEKKTYNFVILKARLDILEIDWKDLGFAKIL